MSNVTIYRRTPKVVAHLPEVRTALAAEARILALMARTQLALHKHEGHSFIELKKGRLDWYVVLNDERGQLAAMSIEYGRRLDGGGRTEPVRALLGTRERAAIA